MSVRHPTVDDSTIDIRQVVSIGTPKAVELWLDAVTDIPDRARDLSTLSKAEMAKLGQLLDRSSGLELLESIDHHLAGPGDRFRADDRHDRRWDGADHLLHDRALDAPQLQGL
jgi:hypothetical protein